MAFILPTNPSLYLTPLAILTLTAAFIQVHRNSVDLKKKKKEIDKKIYESLIMREIGERIGYELNIAKILDTIVDSLDNLIPCSVIGYFLIGPNGLVKSRLHLEESVNEQFLQTMRKYMLESLNHVSQKNFGDHDITESITGTIVTPEAKDAVNSLWLTPIAINSHGVGVMAIANKRPGLYNGPEMEFLIQILNQANRAVNNLETIITSERFKLDAMVSSMADGVLMFDKDLSLTIVNPAAISLLGLSKDAKPSIFEIARILSDKLDLRSKLDESTQTDKVVTFDNLAVGGKISQLFISPVKDAKGQLLGTVVLFHDRTAEKQLEQIRDEFTAMMVHELRAPLTVVKGTTDVILRNPQLSTSDQGKQLLSTMNTSVDSMLSLVNDLLDVAKIESGKFQIISTHQNLSTIINDRVNFFSSLANNKSLTLQSQDIDPHLDLNFDRDRISQVLNNLLSNAIKFTSPGGKVLVKAYRVNSTADVRWQFSDSHVEAGKINIDHPSVLVSVSDTGKGIEQNKIPELFSKFKQLHPVEQEADGEVGTGLGLVIARGIIESHHGVMFVESHFGEGTTFYFTLPL